MRHERLMRHYSTMAPQRTWTQALAQHVVGAENLIHIIRPGDIR
jgi:hypothetical protein